MKKHIGLMIAGIGKCLWENGGFSERYEDLTVFGKLGYHIFIKGFAIAGVTMDDIRRYHAHINA